MKDDVLIKSNKYGITIYFNSDNSFEELLDDVKNKFQSAAKFFNHAKMAVEYEGRSFTEEEERQLTRAIESAAGIEILCIIEKNTATEQVHKKLLDESLEAIHERDGQFYKGTLRGRQVLESEQSIVIIGDVEEGATVASKGNVIVTGTIYGTVIAGAAGRTDAVIAALHMQPKKLRIGGIKVKPVKTTTTANIGAGLSKLGKKVVIIDTDLGLRNLDVVMGMENLVVYNLVDVVEGSCRLKQALIRDSRYENLYLLPSAQTKDKSAVSPGQMKKLTAELKEEFDYILLDCPAGIEQGFQNAIAGADRALVVTTPEVSSIRDADRIIGLLEQNQIRTIDLIINRIRKEEI